MTVMGGKSMLCTAVKGESKGISPASDVFVRRVQIRISRFSEILATSPARGLQVSKRRAMVSAYRFVPFSHSEHVFNISYRIELLFPILSLGILDCITEAVGSFIHP